jgi:hypothetical protein
MIAQALSAKERGAGAEALRLLESVLRVDTRHAAALSHIQTWLSTARTDARSRRTIADALGPDVTASQPYREGHQRELEAGRLSSTRPTEAIQLLWSAASAYSQAVEIGRQRLVQETPPPSPTTPLDANPERSPQDLPPSAPPPSILTTAALPLVDATARIVAPPPPKVAPDTSSQAQQASPSPASASDTLIPQGVREALDRYAAAYGRQDIQGIKAVFPNLPPEREAALNKAFKSGCRSYEVRFSNIEASRVTADSLTILATTTYTCNPSTGQSRQTFSADDVFQMKRVGATWYIDRMQLI